MSKEEMIELTGGLNSVEIPKVGIFKKGEPTPVPADVAKKLLKMKKYGVAFKPSAKGGDK